MKTCGYYTKTMDNNLIYNILFLLGIVVYFPLLISSQVCTETVTKVSECLSDTSEYEKRASEKCSNACKNSTERGYQYKYHCMWDFTHEDLLEMCAIPKYLFGYCPAYDRKGQQIQKDEFRPCNTSSSRTYYNSDELFFCDRTNCLGSFTSTTSDSPSETTDMTTRHIPDGESWYLHLIWIAATVVTCLIIGLIIFLIRKRQQSNESSNGFQIFMPGSWKPQGKKHKENDGVPNGQNPLLTNGV